MKILLLSVPLLLAAAMAPLRAAEVQDERARIAAERAAAQERLEVEQKACWHKFAVNDCINAAKRRQRQTLADLKRQENKLNDQEREQRAAERAKAIEEKRSKAASRADAKAEKHDEAVADQQRREARAAEKAAKRPPASASESSPIETQKQGSTPAQSGQAAAPIQPSQVNPGNEARRRQFEERQRQAQERKAKVLKRQAESGKAPAKALPVPP